MFLGEWGLLFRWLFLLPTVSNSALQFTSLVHSLLPGVERFHRLSTAVILQISLDINSDSSPFGYSSLTISAPAFLRAQILDRSFLKAESTLHTAKLMVFIFPCVVLWHSSSLNQGRSIYHNSCASYTYPSWNELLENALLSTT